MYPSAMKMNEVLKVTVPLSLTSALNGDEWSLHATAVLTLGEKYPVPIG
jgi:hypothetical protein